MKLFIDILGFFVLYELSPMLVQYTEKRRLVTLLTYMKIADISFTSPHYNVVALIFLLVPMCNRNSLICILLPYLHELLRMLYLFWQIVDTQVNNSARSSHFRHFTLELNFVTKHQMGMFKM